MLSVAAREVVAQAYSRLQQSRYGHALPPSLVSLNYHYFTTTKASSYLEVSRGVFERQLDALLQKFSFVAAKPALEAAFHGELKHDGPMAIITIDDACTSLEIVRPLLEKFQIPVVLFAPIGLCLDREEVDGLRSRCLRLYQEVDRSHQRPSVPEDPAEFFQFVLAAEAGSLRLLEDKLYALPRNPDAISKRKLYRAGDLKTLAKDPLISLSPHSMSHQALATLPPAWLEWEIRMSCKYIADLGGDPELFAYPYGDPESVDGRCARVLRQMGSKFAFTTLCYRISSTCDPFLLGRSAVFNCPAPHYIWGTALGALQGYDILRHGKGLYETYARVSSLSRGQEPMCV